MIGEKRFDPFCGVDEYTETAKRREVSTKVKLNNETKTNEQNGRRGK